ncbi:hypothetical protein PG988_005640 [Apiospora saccharicola]
MLVAPVFLLRPPPAFFLGAPPPPPGCGGALFSGSGLGFEPSILVTDSVESLHDCLLVLEVELVAQGLDAGGRELGLLGRGHALQKGGDILHLGGTDGVLLDRGGAVGGLLGGHLVLSGKEGDEYVVPVDGTK